MNIDDIKNIDDFQVYCCTNNEQRYIYSDIVENATPIADCIDLFIVSGTRSMDNISLCTKLRFLSINNYKIGKKELSNLLDYKENLSTITHLYLWNTKLNDLSLLQLFPNLTHLMVAYIRKEDFSFEAEVKQIFESFNDGDEVIVITDIYGGSVNNSFIRLLNTYVFHLIAGMNMSLILQIINENRSIEEQIHALLEENKQMICYCNDIVKKSYQNDEF